MHGNNFGVTNTFNDTNFVYKDSVKKAGTLISTVCLLFSHLGFKREVFLSHILCGDVSVNNCIIKNHVQKVKKDDVVVIVLKSQKYASRGVYKLQPVLERWNINVQDKVYIDVGCATGGFTDVLLEYGAKAVHAVDVAHNTLSYRLRRHKKVYVHEKTNILHIDSLDPPGDCAVVDLSFRSLQGVLPHVLRLCREKYIIALCKPQFEFKMYQTYINKDLIEKKHKHDLKFKFSGVITDLNVQKNILEYTIEALTKENVFTHRVHPAGIRGQKGNQEFFLEITNKSTPKSTPKSKKQSTHQPR